jgi:preprotein translocase subunit SecG
VSYDSSLERYFFDPVRHCERLFDFHRPPAAGPRRRTGRRFGASGGQSAFGTKAGDVFTRITIGVAVVWVALAGITGFAMSRESQNRFQSQATTEPEMFPANPGQTAAGKTGGVGEFEKGNQPSNAGTAGTATGGTATGGTATGTAQPAPSQSPSTATTPATKPPATTPPAKSSPAPNATKPSAPAK